MYKQTSSQSGENETLMRCALRAILENSDDCIFIKDKDVVCRAASRSFLRMMECTPEELYGRPDSEIFRKELADHYRNDDLKVIRDGSAICGRVENALPKEGRERWVQTHKFPIRDEEGAIIGLVGISSQRTNQEGLEQKARDSELTSVLLDNIPAGCGVSHFENGFFYADLTNEGLFLIPWLTPDIVNEAMGANFIKSVHEPDRKALVREYERLRKFPGETGSADFRVRGSDGRLHWLNFKFRRAYLRDGIEYYYVTYDDIDRQKTSEQEYFRAQQMYNYAAQDAELVIWTYDWAEHKAIMLQSGYTGEFCKKLGLPSVIENFPDAALPFLDKQDQESFLKIHRDMENGAPYAEGDFRFQLPGLARQQYERVILRRIEDENGNLSAIHCCGQDITLQKLAQAEYDQLRKQFARNMADVVGSFQVNLSQNRYISGYSPYPCLLRTLETGTADEHFAAAARLAINPVTQEAIQKECNCLHLMEVFQNGNRQIKRDYPIRNARGGVMWIHSTLYMMLNPTTGDLEAITCSTDITKQKKNEEIIDLTFSEGCDYIGIIDIMEHTYERYCGLETYVQMTEGEKCPYDEVRARAIGTYLSPEGKKVCSKRRIFPS